MAISYPLSLPTSIGIANITIGADNAVALSQSPFTYKQQVFRHPGQRWTASITIPPAQKDLVEDWLAFLLSLKGRTGTFLLGDPNRAEPRGTAKDAVETPLVNGVGQVGDSLNIDGLPVSEVGYLLPGDYIQLGSGSTATLHKVLTQVDTNGSGEATLDLWPGVFSAVADNSPVVVNSAKGRFRLAENATQWSIDNASFYGIQFEAVSVIP